MKQLYSCFTNCLKEKVNKNFASSGSTMNTSKVSIIIKLFIYCSVQHNVCAGVFSEKMIWQHHDPMFFWLDLISDVPELAKFARIVLSVRPHVAGCERVWSMSTALFTKSRCRLDPVCFSQLIQVSMHVFVYFM